ncbi:MAG: NADPH-dependent F420 reductase [Anaerolineales bacterium]
MDEKPVISIIGGTGKLGTGLAKRLVLKGYEVILGSRDEERAVETAEEINEDFNVDLVRGMLNPQAAQAGDINILSVVQSAHEAALNALKEDLRGKILVDATARITFPNPTPPEPPSAPRRAQTLLGGEVPVVAAFQNIAAQSLADVDKEIESDVLVCADDQRSARTVMKVIEDLGMHAYYAGDLDAAIAVEGLTAILVNINRHNEIDHASIRITGE